jgi:anion-transporting  ArsA/GET3 family ATPase
MAWSIPLSQVDQFESVFRSALKDVYSYTPLGIHSVLLVTDLEGEHARSYQQRVQGFLEKSRGMNHTEYTLVQGNEFGTTAELLELVEQYSPDLIFTYRNLHSRAWRFPHSLGEHLDVLLQKTGIPVMVLPHPEAGYEAEHAFQDTSEIMVVTDLLAVNDRLIDHAVAFSQAEGSLYLSHVEDRRIFERYMDAISKIDVIDTDLAHQRLKEQLLKEPEDYFHSCAEVLKKEFPRLKVLSLVTFGELVEEYRHQIESRKLDLLVLSAKDERQHAMHSVAYPLAIELRQIPLLML